MWYIHLVSICKRTLCDVVGLRWCIVMYMSETVVAIWTWVNVSAWLCLCDTNDVVLWLCSGFYFKHTVCGQTYTHTHTHTHTHTQTYVQSEFWPKYSPKEALTPNQECGGFKLCVSCIWLCLWISGLCICDICVSPVVICQYMTSWGVMTGSGTNQNCSNSRFFF